MIVYAVDTKDGEPRLYFATRKEAVAFAKDSTGTPPVGEVIEVSRVELVPMTRAAIVRLLNIEGRYVEDERVVATFPSTSGRMD